MTYVNLHLSVPYSQLMHGYLNHHKSDLNTSVLDFVYRSLQIFCQLRGRTIKGTNNCIIVLANMNIYVHTFQLYSKIYFWGVSRVRNYTTTVIVSVFSVSIKIFVEIFISFDYVKSDSIMSISHGLKLNLFVYNTALICIRWF